MGNYYLLMKIFVREHFNNFLKTINETLTRVMTDGRWLRHRHVCFAEFPGLSFGKGGSTAIPNISPAVLRILCSPLWYAAVLTVLLICSNNC